MTDIGDDVTVQTTITVDDVPTNAVTVVLAVTDPTGATITPPSVSNPSTGVYLASFEATIPGRWLWTWTSTIPDAVDHGYTDVRVDPPARPQPLALTTDLEELLGRSLTPTEARQAPGLLRSASTRVRAFCRQQFDRKDDDVVILRPVDDKLRLPERPVLDVTLVELVGSNTIPDIAVPGWTFDGIDTINIAGLNSNTFVALPAWWDDLDRGLTTYRVTYSHGYDQYPEVVRDVTASAALRTLLSPTPVESQTQLTVGQYSEQFQQAAGTPGRAVRLSAVDKRDLIDAGFRRTAGTIQVR